MHKKITTLGLLSLEDKKKYWKSHISGSQVRRIISEPITFLKEKWGLIKTFDPGKDPEQTESFNNYVKMRIKEGRYLEDTIINICQKEHKYLPPIKILKDTFIMEGGKYSANIDGFIGESFENIESIVEVKDSTVKNFNDIIDRYIYQMMFYMWFFNSKSCYFLVRQTTNKWITGGKGDGTFKFQKPYTDYVVELIKRDKEEEEKMLTLIDIWFKALENLDESLIYWGEGK